MGNLNVELARAQKQGAEKMEKFSGAVRQVENVGLNKGDTFVIPKTYDVYRRKFGNNYAEFIMVKFNNNENDYRPFYPSTFTKSRTIYNEDKTSTGQRIHTDGTAAKHFQDFGDVQAAMDSIKGKKIVVSDIRQVRTMRFGMTELMMAQIPTLDFVE